MPQMINGFVFLLWSLFYFISVAIKGPENFKATSIANSIFTGLVALFWLHNVYFTQVLGAGGFSKLRVDGPYKVGVRYFHFKSKDLEVMCFYPIDEAEYQRKKRHHMANWMYRPQTLAGMQQVYKHWFKVDFPTFVLRPQQVMKKDAIINGDLAFDFASGSKKLRPVLFSHGLFANNISYTGL